MSGLQSLAPFWEGTARSGVLVAVRHCLAFTNSDIPRPIAAFLGFVHGEAAVACAETNLGSQGERLEETPWFAWLNASVGCHPVVGVSGKDRFVAEAAHVESADVGSSPWNRLPGIDTRLTRHRNRSVVIKGKTILRSRKRPIQDMLRSEGMVRALETGLCVVPFIQSNVLVCQRLEARVHRVCVVKIANEGLSRSSSYPAVTTHELDTSNPEVSEFVFR